MQIKFTPQRGRCCMSSSKRPIDGAAETLQFAYWSIHNLHFITTCVDTAAIAISVAVRLCEHITCEAYNASRYRSLVPRPRTALAQPAVTVSPPIDSTLTCSGQLLQFECRLIFTCQTNSDVNGASYILQIRVELRLYFSTPEALLNERTHKYELLNLIANILNPKQFSL